MDKKYIAFICKANVGRSQMAEAYYKKYGNHTLRAISFAGVEDRHEKYHGNPDPSVAHVMQEDEVDISHQVISFLSDFSDILDQIKYAIVLFDPSVDNTIDERCLYEWKDPLDTLKKHGVQILSYPIDDPYNQGENTIREIRDQIKQLIQQKIVLLK